MDGASWLLLVVVLCLPTATAVSTGLVHAWRRPRGPTLAQPTGAWAREEALRLGLDVSVGVAPRATGGADGTWPHARLVALSAQTWRGRLPRHRATAAHELGHAKNLDLLDRWSEPMLAGRRLEEPLGALCAGALALAIFWGMAGAQQIALGAAVGAAMSASLSWLEERWASSHARRLLAAAMHPEALIEAHRELRRSEALYLARALSRWAVVALVPLLRLPGVSTSMVPAAVGVWTVVLFAPLFILRAAQVLRSAAAPPEELALRQAEAHREAAWDIGLGWAALTMWLSCAAQPFASGLGGLALLASVAAWLPVGAVGKALAWAPLAALTPTRDALDPTPDEGEARRTAERALASAPHPRWMRGLGLLRIAWLPLWTVLAWRLLTG